MDGAQRPSRTSCLINSYDYREYVTQAVDSALAQSVPPDQLVDIDDGSGSIEVIGAGGDVKIVDGSGSISVEQVRGSVTINDGSGSIHVKDVDRDVLIEEDGSGGVSVANVRGDVIADS